MKGLPQVRGGLTFREGHYICEAISETGLLAALDIVVGGWRNRGALCAS